MGTPVGHDAWRIIRHTYTRAKLYCEGLSVSYAAFLSKREMRLCHATSRTAVDRGGRYGCANVRLWPYMHGLGNSDDSAYLGSKVFMIGSHSTRVQSVYEIFSGFLLKLVLLLINCVGYMNRAVVVSA